jgi:ppGpp synthetase/RelA/SpoT-type nucleotidyltranferase
VKAGDKLIEVHVRTSLQHVWAELSEKYSDVIDPAIKYGGGDASVQEILHEMSALIAGNESNEKEVVDILASEGQVPDELTLKAKNMKESLREEKARLYNLSIRFAEVASALKGKNQ